GKPHKNDPWETQTGALSKGRFIFHKKLRPMKYKSYCSRVGTFGTESAVRKRGGSRNLPYLNAKPRQIPLLGTYA
ncbi:MAG: hypothetical protein KBH65_02675, partial [Clostridium sp.]|nr:hypothetical protein [Clostridium sp.]